MSARSMKFTAVPVAFFLYTLFVSAGSAETRIADDKGGSVGKYLLMFSEMRDSGQHVVIDGDCLSACTLVTAMLPASRVCVTDRAALGFHAGWVDDEAGNRVVSPEGTRLLFLLYPPKIRSWI